LMEQHSLLTGRVLLCCAWIFPVFLTVPGQPTVLETAAAALIAIAPAGLIASLPGRVWKGACVLSVVALPFTLWWCGFAAIDHAGPGIEPARALGAVSYDEGLGVARTVAQEPAFIIATVGHCVLLLLACKSGFFPRNARRPAGKVAWRRVVLLFSLLPLSLSALMGMNDFSEHRGPFFGPQTLASPLGSAGEIALDKLRLSFGQRELEYRRHQAHSSIRVTQPILAMLVVGESVRAGFYGPDQAGRGPASRELAERIRGGLGSWLPPTCASSDATHLSVPLLLTALPPEERSEAPITPTVLGILKASGFSTAWLANNEAGEDSREAGHDFYSGRWPMDPSQFRNMQVRTSWVFDEEMLPVARHFVGDVNKPKAILLHTFGSHAPYSDRYPAKFFPAESASLDTIALEDLRYARATEYGAKTIVELAQMLDSTLAPAFLVYTSDHGENLHSDRNGMFMHVGPRTSVEDGTVPSFALWNKAMAETRSPNIAVSKLVAAKMIAHADVARLFLTLAGVRSGPVEPTSNPTIWGRVTIGDPYSSVPCSALRP
jgi:glucan phosphoethanolaminetransferase (alkaline phosphatase superfamily)